MSIIRDIKDKFFQGSYYRVDYALELMKRIYIKYNITREPKLEDLRKHFKIEYWQDECRDIVNGHPDNYIPSFYIPFDDEIKQAKKDDVLSDELLEALISDI